VSNASEDLPLPDSPVITTNSFLGMETLRFFKLFILDLITSMGWLVWMLALVPGMNKKSWATKLL